MPNIRRFYRLALLSAGMTFGSAHAHDYSRACCALYTGGCGGSALPNSCDNTDSMSAEIVARLSNWSSGYSYKNGSVNAHGFSDEVKSTNGIDNLMFDKVGKADLFVWSGHGTSSTGEPNGSWCAAPGTPFDPGDACYACTPSQMVFGEQSSDGYGNNGDAEFLIMDASCSGLHGERADVWENYGPGLIGRVHQGMAFNDSPNDSSTRLRKFIERIDAGDSNGEAWLDVGRECFLGICSNSPWVISRGMTASDASDRFADESMASPETDPSSMWGGNYYVSYVGSTGSECGM